MFFCFAIKQTKFVVDLLANQYSFHKPLSQKYFTQKSDVLCSCTELFANPSQLHCSLNHNCWYKGSLSEDIFLLGYDNEVQNTWTVYQL